MNHREVLTVPRTTFFMNVKRRAPLIAAALALAAAVLGPSSAVAQSCDQLFASYDNSSWWWGAFGNCKTGPGGETDRTAIFNCAFTQVPPSHRTDCLREKLFASAQTSQGIDVVVAANKLPGCDNVFASYDNSSWWWGAFGNCKTGSGGETDRTKIFNCAWAQVPPSDQTDCLREKLTQTVQTSQGIDV
jgi:hypothetical protein